MPVSELFKSQNQKLSYYTYKIGQVHSIYETFSVFKVHIAESFEAVPLSRQSQVDNLLTTTLFIKLNFALQKLCIINCMFIQQENRKSIYISSYSWWTRFVIFLWDITTMMQQNDSSNLCSMEKNYRAKLFHPWS